MEDVVLLEWSYTPSDYFEDEIHIIKDNYEMNITEGKVVARIDPSIYDHEHKLRDHLHESLYSRFLGVQLLMHKPYDLSAASMSRLHSDGRKDVTIFAESGVFALSGCTADFVVRDKDGNIVSDSRRDRIEKKKKLADLAAEYSSKYPLVTSLLKIYQAAVQDPDNELVHLYEIRDALSRLFSGKKLACIALGITSSDWSRLGQLANNEPLKQGRHRGKSTGTLRKATKKELKEARDIARSFIEAYLVYLDTKNSQIRKKLNKKE